MLDGSVRLARLLAMPERGRSINEVPPMRVLIAYDGSSGATKAVALAQSIEWPNDSLIRVVTMVEPTVMAMSGPWDRGAALTPELDAAITESANEMMREAVDRLGPSNTSVDGQVL